MTKHYTKIKESAETIELDDRRLLDLGVVFRHALDKIIKCNRLRIADSIGPTLTSDQAPGTIRRFYAQNFNKLDQFDRLFYEIRPLKAARRWESYFVWSLLHTSLINARSAYCHAHQRRVSFAEFLLDGLIHPSTSKENTCS